MVEALKQYPGNSSAIIPIIIWALLLVSTLAAVFSSGSAIAAHRLGIFLTGAIALIAFG